MLADVEQRGDVGMRERRKAAGALDEEPPVRRVDEVRREEPNGNRASFFRVAGAKQLSGSRRLEPFQ